MEEYVPKKKKHFFKKISNRYVYLALICVMFLFGISYSLVFFMENRNIGTGELSVGGLTYNISNRDIDFVDLSPSSDTVGINSLNNKTLTITNSTQINGIVKVNLTRTSGLDLTDLRYVLYINDIIMNIDDVSSDGLLYESVIFGNETINVKVTLWPKSSYSGNVTTFVGKLEENVSLGKELGAEFLSSLSSLTNNYVNFNCDGYTCEKWRIVKVEDGRIVLTKNSDYENASLRTDSGLYDSSLSYNDNTNLVVSQSTDKKNVYLAKTTEIINGIGTENNPYVLDNKEYSAQDEKIIATLTYNDCGLITTQPIFNDRTNYVSIEPPIKWNYNANSYYLGDSFLQTSDFTLIAEETMTCMISKKSDQNIDYILNYTTNIINNGNPTFTTQDTVEINDNKKDVYYYTGSQSIDNANVLFAGYCWQIVRTTDTGGVRLIYNGFAQNNKCLDSRSETTWKGVNDVNHERKNIQGDYLYADSFDYDFGTNRFNLVDKEENKRSWSQDNFTSFIGKYTCLNDDGNNCENVYYVGQRYVDSSYALVEKYSIGNIENYRQIGSSAFNSGQDSVSNVGYMFNKLYQSHPGLIGGNGITENAIYGKNVKYENGVYTVYNDDPEETINTTTINEYYHFSCGTTTTCQEVKYYFYYLLNKYNYILLTGGETEIDALRKMINYKTNSDEQDENVNYYNSTIKGYLEIWYNKNLKDYESFIDVNAVYCNNRKVKVSNYGVESLGGWDRTRSYKGSFLLFNQYSSNVDLSCDNETDRFSKNNLKAKLDSPIGLITESERGLMTADYAVTGTSYWLLSPNSFNDYSSSMVAAYSDGEKRFFDLNASKGVRPAITLKNGTKILGGDGTKNSPYQIGPLVTRTN